MLQWMQGVLGLGGGTATGLQILSPDIGQSIGWVQTLADVIKSHGVYALGGAIIFLMILIEAIKYLTQQDAAEGRYTPSAAAPAKEDA